ncbi:MAG: hypothetical protein COA94_08495 [Rickettsiales bacterium]|nr:MAG: hypothetical protein COA94_08495 [Rickettsiales bacterium]
MSSTKWNNYELAVINRDIYKVLNFNEHNYGLEEITKLGYTIKSISGKGQNWNGFFAILLEKNGKHIIAIQGTNASLGAPITSVGDFLADADLIAGKMPERQFSNLMEFVERVKTEYNIQHIDLFTGHSLGGSLATLGAIAQNSEAVTFDPVGVKRIVETYFDFDVDDSMVTNFVSKANGINGINKQFGGAIQFQPNVGEYNVEGLDSMSVSASVPIFYPIGMPFSVPLSLLPNREHALIQKILIKAVKYKILFTHSIENMAKMFNKDGSIAVSYAELNSYGGNINEAIHSTVNYAQSQAFWNHVTKRAHQNPAFKNLSFEELKAKLLNGYLLNEEIIKIVNKEISFYTQLSGTNITTDPEYSIDMDSHLSRTQELLAPIAQKIKSGEELTDEEFYVGISVAQGYFIKKYHHSGNEDHEYNYNFITGTGEVGKFTNAMLTRNCGTDGAPQAVRKCHYSKIMLAFRDVEASSANPNRALSLADHDQVRAQAFADVGVDQNADLLGFVCALSNNRSAKCGSVNEVLSELKPHINITLQADGTSVVTPKALANFTSEIITAIAAFQETLTDFFGLTSQTRGASFVAESADSLAQSLGVDSNMIDRKYGSDDYSDAIRTSVGDTLPVFSVRSRNEEVRIPFLPGHGSEQKVVMADPEFTVRMAISPVSFLRPEQLETKSVLYSVVSAPSTDDSRLVVDISPEIHDRHEAKSSEELGSMWRDGVAAYGGHHEVRMPAGILNGDGYVNVRPSSIVTGGWRPGAAQLSDFSTDSFLQQLPGAMMQESPECSRSVVMKSRLEFNRCRISAFDQLNIDPLVVDMSARGRSGIKLTHWQDNEVLFDIDGDGYLEETGWIRDKTGLLVLDEDGSVTSVHQLLSEHFQGGSYSDGFEALRQFDINGDGIIDSSDPVYHRLKVWFDLSKDGICREGELKSLTELGIKQIILNDLVEVNSERSGNLIKQKGVIVMEDGSHRVIASVDFLANASGHKYEETEGGIRIASVGRNVRIVENKFFQKLKDEEVERETATFFAKEGSPTRLEADALKVDNICASSAGSVLVGGNGDNWLIGSDGADQYLGGSGNNTLVINEHDRQEDIQGGIGFNTVFINSVAGRYFSLDSSGIAVVYGSRAGDVLDARSTNYNCFVQAGDGSSLMFGGSAASVLSGGAGDDIITSGSGGGILRANLGNNFLIARGGNTILESGLGFNYLRGSNENNIFKCNAKGFSICDGSEGKFNALQLAGSIYDYSMEYNEEGHVVVRNKNYYSEFSAVLINIHLVNFGDMRNYNFNLILPQKWVMQNDFSNLQLIDASELFSHEFGPRGQQIGFAKVHKTEGCSIQDEQGRNLADIAEQELFFIERFSLAIDSDHKGPVFIQYTPRTRESRVCFSFDTKDGEISNSAISLVLFRGDISEISNYYFDLLRIDYLRENNYLGQGVNVQVCEQRSDHAQGVWSVLKNILPEGRLYFTDQLFSAEHAKMDVLNFSISFHSPIRTNMEYNHAIGYTGGLNHLDAAARKTVLEGRDGLGLAVIFAAGNERQDGGDANYDLIKSIPSIIVVGGISRKSVLGLGEQPNEPFSSPGSNILTSAPANFIPAVTHGQGNKYGNYFKDSHALVQGTSFAAPIVSGIVGAMLQVNKHLTIYDIQKILAYSSKQIESETEWQFNGASTWNGGGLHFSYDFGFGCIDAHNALLLAQNWLVGNRQYVERKWVFSNGTFHAKQSASFNSSATIDGEIVSTNVNFIIKEIDIFNLKLSLAYDGQTFTILKPKVGDDLSFPTLSYAAMTPLTHFLMGMRIDSQIGCLFENTGAGDMKFGVVNMTAGVQRDNNTSYIFTDECTKFYDEDRATLAAQNQFNTLNLAAVSYSSRVNLQEMVMYLAEQLYRLEGAFHNVISGSACTHITGNEENNIIVSNGSYSEVTLITGHNIVSSSSQVNSTTKITSGDRADTFVIKRSAGSTIIIEGFKVLKFDTTPSEQMYSDVVNLAAFEEITVTSDLILETEGSDRIICLPDNQKVVLKNVDSMRGYNFRFNKDFYIAHEFEEDFMHNNIIQNLMFGPELSGVDAGNSILASITPEEVGHNLYDAFSGMA